MAGPNFTSDDLDDLIQHEGGGRVSKFVAECRPGYIELKTYDQLALDLDCMDYDDPTTRGVFEGIKSVVLASRWRLWARCLHRAAYYGVSGVTVLVSLSLLIDSIRGETGKTWPQVVAIFIVVALGVGLTYLLARRPAMRAIVSFDTRSASPTFWQRNRDALIVNGVVALASVLAGAIVATALGK